MLIAKSFAEVEYLLSSRTYEDAIRIHGVTHEQAWALSLKQEDQIPFPASVTGFQVAPSPIHGLGLFATHRFEAGSTLAPARIDGKRTPAGRYCNHGSNPNSKMMMSERSGDVHLVALKVIEPGEEILNDYFFNFSDTRPNPTQISGRKKV